MIETKDIDKERIYIAALLHDIGKFIERSKDKDWQDNAYKYVRNREASDNFAHRRYSALFVEEYFSEKDFSKDNFNSISELVLHHHNDNPSQVSKYLSIDNRGVPQKIIRIADDLAASERLKDEILKPLIYYKANLESPFNDIRVKDEKGGIKSKDKKEYLPTTKLDLEKTCQFPIEKNEAENNQYEKLVPKFLEEVKDIESEIALLFLMEKYLINVPAQSPKEFNNEKHPYKADINLYDHSRVVAAIAIVLYEEYINGSYKGKEKNICSKDYKSLLTQISNPAILICGNVNEPSL